MYTPFVRYDFLMLLIEIPVHIMILVLLEDDLFMLVCKLCICFIDFLVRYFLPQGSALRPKLFWTLWLSACDLTPDFYNPKRSKMWTDWSDCETLPLKLVCRRLFPLEIIPLGLVPKWIFDAFSLVLTLKSVFILGRREYLSVNTQNCPRIKFYSPLKAR